MTTPPDERDRVELTMLGQIISITGSHILPLLLVVMLFANTVMMALHIRAMNETISTAIISAAASGTSAVAAIRAEQSSRQGEHADIMMSIQHEVGARSEQIVRAISDQSTHFDQELKRKIESDVMAHSRLERVITRACRAREKDFARLFNLYVFNDEAVQE